MEIEQIAEKIGGIIGIILGISIILGLIISCIYLIIWEKYWNQAKKEYFKKLTNEQRLTIEDYKRFKETFRIPKRNKNK